MSLKTYVLLEDTRPSAPIYTVVNKQRIKNNSIPKWRPHLMYTFASGDGKNVTTRFKLNSNSIFQDHQIKEENIPANAKFTTAERNALKFTNGVLVTGNGIGQKFLEEGCPDFEGFNGVTPEPVKPMFRIYDRGVEVKNQNSLTKKTVEAANKIFELDLAEAQKLLIRVNGVGYTPPQDDLEECQNILIEYMDSSEEAVDNILKQLISDEEKVKVMVGTLVAAGIISFDAKPNEVSKRYGNGWQKLMDLSSTEFDFDQRSQLFCEFLLKPEIKPVRLSLEKEASKLDNK